MERQPQREGNGHRAQGMNPLNAPAQPGGRDHTPSGRGSQFASAMSDRHNATTEDYGYPQGPAEREVDITLLHTPHEVEHRGIVRNLRDRKPPVEIEARSHPRRGMQGLHEDGR